MNFRQSLDSRVSLCCQLTCGRGFVLQDLVHPQMHPLDDIPTVIEDPPDVLCVHSAREVRIAVVGAVLLGVTTTRLLRYLKEIVPDEVFRSCKFSFRALIYFLLTLWRQHVVDELREVILQL